MTASDPDHPQNELTFVIQAGPSGGHIELRDSANPSVPGPTRSQFTAAEVDTNSVFYVPDPDFNGSDSMTVRLQDGDGAQAEAQTVEITVAASNDDPVITAGTLAETVPENTTLAFTDAKTVSFADVDAAESPGDYLLTINVAVGTIDMTADPSLVVSGALESDGVGLQGSYSVLQQALETLTYTAPFNVATETTFSLEVVVYDAENDSDVEYIALTLEPADSPPVVTINPVSVDQGDSVLLRPGDPDPIEVSDPDSADSDLVYHLSSLPNYGSLFVSGSPITELSQTFTHADLGLVSYQHDGTEAIFTDSFAFEVVDETAAVSGAQTLEITINAINNSPVIGTGQSTIEPVEATPFPFEGSELITITDDASTDGSSVRLSLEVSGTGPVGTLAMTVDPSLIIAGGLDTSEITLEGPVAALNAALASLVYTSADEPSTFSHLLSIDVNDLGNTGPPGPNLTAFENITIDHQLVNDPPEVTFVTATAAEGDDTPLANLLTVADPDHLNSELVFHLSSLPGDGDLEIDGVAITSTSTTFTYQQVVTGSVRYQHDGNDVDTSDSFGFEVIDDGAAGSGAKTLTITVDPVNDAPEFTFGSLALEVDEGGSLTLTTDHFTTSDADDGPEALTYQLGNFPDNGDIVVGGEIVVTTADTFTQQQLADGVVEYVHDGGGSLSALFSLVVLAAAAADSSGNINVTVDSQPDITSVTCTWRPVSSSADVSCLAIPPVRGAPIFAQVNPAPAAGETAEFDWDGRGYSTASGYRTYNAQTVVDVRVTDGDGDEATSQLTIPLAGDRADGHLVIIGHDYTGTVPADGSRLLVNSLYLSDAPDSLSVVAFRQYATTDQITGIDAALDGADFMNRIPASSTFSVFVDTDPIGTALAEADVFIIYPMAGISSNGTTALAAAWKDELEAFLYRGGVVVAPVQAVSKTRNLLRSLGLADYNAGIADTGNAVTYGTSTAEALTSLVPDNPPSALTRGLSETYALFGSSATLQLAGSTNRVAYSTAVLSSNNAHPIALHRVFGSRGEVVVLGHDYRTTLDELYTMLGNAIMLAEPPATGVVRYALWTPEGLGASYTAAITTDIGYYNDDTSRDSIMQRANDITTIDPLELAGLVDAIDVLILPELESPGDVDLFTLGFDLRGGHGGDVLGDLLARGGVLIVMEDGLGSNTTTDLLVGAGLLDITNLAQRSTGDTLARANTDDPLVRPIEGDTFDSYSTPDGTATFVAEHAHVAIEGPTQSTVIRGRRPGCVEVESFEHYVTGLPSGRGGFPDSHWTSSAAEPSLTIVPMGVEGWDGVSFHQAGSSSDWWFHTSSSLQGRQSLEANVNGPGQVYLLFGSGCGASDDAQGVMFDSANEVVSSGTMKSDIWTEIESVPLALPLSDGSWARVVVEPIDIGPNGLTVLVSIFARGPQNQSSVAHQLRTETALFFPNAVGSACTWGGNVGFRTANGSSVDGIQLCQGWDESISGTSSRLAAPAAIPACSDSATDIFTGITYVSRNYAAPSAARSAALVASIAACLEDADDCLGRVEDAGYDICADNDLLVWTPEDTTIGDAYFAVRTGSARSLIVEVPHPDFDTDTDVQGIEMLTNLTTRALIISGTERCAAAAASSCSGETTVCNAESEPYRVSDMAHVVNSTFHAVHGALAARYSGDTVLSLHGMSLDGISVSNGTRANIATDAPVGLLTRELLSQWEEVPYITACNDDGAREYTVDARLCGLTNVQGRLINEVSSQNACTTDASRASERFIHFEQNLVFRNDATNRGLIETALDAVFPFDE